MSAGVPLLKKIGRNPKCDRDWCENEIKKISIRITEEKYEFYYRHLVTEHYRLSSHVTNTKY